MGLSVPVVNAIIEVLQTLGPGTKVLSLGYPDILKDIKDVGLEGLEEHPDSASIAAYHGRTDLKVPTAESFFKALGAELTVIDQKAWRGPEITFDLNEPHNTLSDLEFGLVIDPGALEHCFNITQAITHILDFTKVGGYILHWNPFFMPNYGFFNINPTFYWDWYLANGGSVRHSTIWVRNEDGTEVSTIPPSAERFNIECKNASLLTITKKIEDVDSITWPTQSKYARMQKMGT